MHSVKPVRRCGSFGRGDPIERLLREISGTRQSTAREATPKSAIAGNRKYRYRGPRNLATWYSIEAAT